MYDTLTTIGIARKSRVKQSGAKGAKAKPAAGSAAPAGSSAVDLLMSLDVSPQTSADLKKPADPLDSLLGGLSSTTAPSQPQPQPQQAGGGCNLDSLYQTGMPMQPQMQMPMQGMPGMLCPCLAHGYVAQDL